MCLGIVLSMAVAMQGAKVTPMEKVISLLKDLSAKVAAEGKKEAAQYDKFACFCKEQADEKLYGIEKSDAKIADLKAEIGELDTAIAKLNGEISDLSKQISSLEGEIKRKTDKRDKEHAEYQVRANDMNEAIDACGAAIEALRDSKGAMSGAKTTNLVQVTTLIKAVEKLGKGAPKFQYQSNDIIATIEDLQVTFKSMKKDLDFAEHDTNSAFEKDRLGLQNEKKFAAKERDEKDAIVESKSEDRQAAKQDKDDEQADRDADQNFLDELTSQCENTARLFDQRSSTRADELTALSTATQQLQDGAVPNFGANKKLTGFTQKSITLSKASPVSFVQVNSVQHDKSGRDAVLERVRTFLDGAADRTGSRALSALATRVSVAADHFVKVRGLIKDLIAKLKADAKAEATQKGVCDTGMAKAISDRDTANANIETANAKITTNTATKNSLEDEINTLNSQISELKKGLLEATELRNTDKEDNAETIRMSQEGADAVKLALGTLKGFYDNAFMQTRKYTPPNADADGNTVGDLAPEFASEKNHGSQSESKGIVGILEVILSDFERTNSKTKSDDKDSQSAFDTFEKDTNDDVGKKNKRIKAAQGELSTAESNILDAQQALSDANELFDGALESLEDLEAMCVKGEETWEERKKAREEEIEALKEALEIFENWQD
jgi:chromosome segregation ATPase